MVSRVSLDRTVEYRRVVAIFSFTFDYQVDLFVEVRPFGSAPLGNSSEVGASLSYGGGTVGPDFFFVPMRCSTTCLSEND